MRHEPDDEIEEFDTGHASGHWAHSRESWRVLERGFFRHWAGVEVPTAKSTLVCLECGEVWRSKASFIARIRDFH